jgi:hypothetical protein
MSGALTSRLKGWEESIVHLLSTVDPQPIDAVRGDEISDPGFERAQHISIFCSEVRERDNVISFPADLDTRCIIVINETERMVVGFLVWISRDQSFGEPQSIPS